MSYCSPASRLALVIPLEWLLVLMLAAAMALALALALAVLILAMSEL